MLMSPELVEEIHATMERYRAQYTDMLPPHGSISVGSAMFDPWLRFAILSEILRAVRTLPEMEWSRTVITYVHDCVRIHNAKRPKDINWPRWIYCGDDFANWWIDRIVAENFSTCS